MFTEERVSEIKNGSYFAIVTSELPRLQGITSQKAIVTGIRKRLAPPDARAPAPPPTDSLQRTAARALDFVINTYESRRPHWTPAFLNKLRKVALDYLNESTYIIVQDGVIGRDGRTIRGTLRIIRERDGLLPMEKYLGIQLESGGLLKIEPGNFAIAKEVSQEAWPEVIMQLLSGINREVETGRKNLYFTYADQYSLALYAQLGFKPVDAAKIKNDPGVEVADGKILKDGIWWTPMEAQQETIDQLLEVHVARLERRGLPSKEIDRLRKRQSEIDQESIDHERRFVGRGRGPKGEFQAELEIDYQWPSTFSFVMRNNGLRETNNLLLSIENLPLKEGPLPWQKGQSPLSYRNGVLIYSEHDHGRQVDIEIEISPDLRFVRRFKKRQISNNEVIADYEVEY